MTDISPVTYAAADGIATVTLNRPDQRNAVNPAVCDGMRAAIDRAEADAAVRVVILRGAGPVFCAGMDLRAFQAGQSDAILFGTHGFAGFVKRQRSKPVIAAVQGAALAGGFEIMLACDLVVASDDARFGLPEVSIGLVAGAGGAIRLPVQLPPVIANQILLTGQTFGTDQALAWGLVNAVCAPDALWATAMALARQIAAQSPNAVRTTLAITQMAATSPHWAQNDAALDAVGRHADAAEGISAFLEKRAPVWQ